MAVPTFVRSLGSAIAAAAAQDVLTLANAVPVGDTILLVTQGSSTVAVAATPVSDTQGNTWVTDFTGTGTGNTTIIVYSCRVTTALGVGDQITFSKNASDALSIGALHVSGRVGVVDKVIGNAGVSVTSSTSTSGTTAAADEFVLGIGEWTTTGGVTVALTTGYTDIFGTVNNATGSMIAGYKTAAAVSGGTTQSVTATATGGTPTRIASAVLTYRGQTRRYVDYTKADNTLSGLSWANAKKDIASAGALAGDLVTVAKSADPTAMTGTLAFVDNSASISTTADQSLVAVAKSMIGAATDGSKGWWEVSAVTSTTITLVTAYAGTTETVTGYKLGVNDAGSPAAGTTVVAGSGTAGTAQDHVTVVGGYNTGTDTRDGYTHYWVSGATKNGVVTITNSFNDWSYIGSWRTANGWTCTTANTTCDHVQAGATSAVAFNGVGGNNSTLTNFVATGAGTNGASMVSGTSNIVCTNGTVLHPGGAGFIVGGANNLSFVLTNVTINRSTTGGLTPSGVGRFVNWTIKNSGTNGVVNGGTQGFFQFANCTFGSGNASGDLAGTMTGQQFYYSCLFTSSTVIATTSTGPDVVMDRYQQTQGSYRRYVAGLGIVLTNTANSRSGTAMELQFSNAAPVAGTQDGYLEQVFPIPGQAGVARTVNVWVAKSSAWNGDSGASPPSAFGSTAGQLRVGLRWNGDWVSGAPDTTKPTTSYVQRQYSYTPSEDGTLELVVQAGGNAGSIYLDDVAWQ
jgi:hypothetical protein